jgi:hypothetical protein
MINTNWNAQGQWTEPGARFDLRFEYIDQDQPMAGSRKVGVGEIPPAPRRGAHPQPQLARHLRLHVQRAPGACRPRCRSSTSSTAHITTTWARRSRDLELHRSGDARVLGRRQWHAESAGAERLDFYGLNFGLKLPTGQDRRDELGGRARGAHAAARDRHHRSPRGRLLQPRARLRLLVVRRPAGAGRRSTRTTDFKPGRAHRLDLGYRQEPRATSSA